MTLLPWSHDQGINRTPHHREALLTQQPCGLCPQLGTGTTGTHSIMGHLLECIGHAVRLVEDQAKIFEASRVRKISIANLLQSSACSLAIESNKFNLDGVDHMEYRHFIMMPLAQSYPV